MVHAFVFLEQSNKACFGGNGTFRLPRGAVFLWPEPRAVRPRYQPGVVVSHVERQAGVSEIRVSSWGFTVFIFTDFIDDEGQVRDVLAAQTNRHEKLYPPPCDTAGRPSYNLQQS